MKKQVSQIVLIIVFFILSAVANCPARNMYSSDIQSRLYDIDDPPCAGIAVHNIGRMHMTVSNYGIIGLPGMSSAFDPLTGDPAPSWTYPPGYELNYLYEATLWVGTVIGRDTLVSTPNGLWYNESVREFWPLPCPDGRIKYRSSTDRCSPEFDSSVSNQDFIAVYTDTIQNADLTGYDNITGRLHIPIRVEVTQKSYAWAYSYAEDFVIMDFEIGNIELRDLEDVYIGLYVDNDCGKTNSYYYPYDDICGYQKALPSQYIWGLIDTLDLVWAADNDGDPDPISGQFAGYRSPTSVVATKILRTPTNDNKFSFNWWVPHWDLENDWGPRKSDDGRVRTFNGRLGTPVGDNNKYYIMASREFDYNQSDIFLDHTHDGWLPVPQHILSNGYGANISYLLSFGPFDMKAGEILPLTVAFVSGEQFHPGRNFADLQMNALWSSWIYDNPGVDTDGDGYKGKYYRYCLRPSISRIDTFITSPTDTIFDTVMSCLWSDTIWYEGDGVPDFVGAKPPLCPKAELYPELDANNLGKITIRWNGLLSETTPDQFSQENDFEGYRIYISHSGQQCDYTLITSYDLENYDRYEFFSGSDNQGNYQTLWKVKQPPFTLEELKQMYGNDFDPNQYYDSKSLFTSYNYTTGNYESYYFKNHDFNSSDISNKNEIHKVYDKQAYPSTLNLDTANMFYPYEVTKDGQLKYFEYEYVLKDLLPSIPYFISVTAFDHGVPQNNLSPQEADPADSNVTIKAYAQNSNKKIREEGLDVIVYPNPYRIDGDYRDYYEGWQEPTRPHERTRAIHFTNLPSVCTIRIFSIDGDLIRTIEHNYPEGAPSSMHDTWDLVSRNEMAISSGIYYFTVESAQGNQIGKIVIIY